MRLRQAVKIVIRGRRHYRRRTWVAAVRRVGRTQWMFNPSEWWRCSDGRYMTFEE